MPSLNALLDNFNDGALGPEWGNSYGGTTETGGRARVPCTTGYAGCQTAYSWTLAGAALYVQVPTVPVASTATEAYCGVMIQSVTAGTRAGFIINAVTGLLRCKSETGYYDPDSVDITYSAVDHRWLRIREDGTNVYWDTSPDGSTWTTRRTLATPAWVLTETDALALDMSSHRDAGTDDYAEYDCVNTLADGAVWDADAALGAEGGLTAAAAPVTVTSTDLTADGSLSTPDPAITAMAEAGLGAESDLTAESVGQDRTDIDFAIGQPTPGWTVSAPWK
ncbi:hypothetical protein [Streptomyces uncialis]|uniref:Uncharacterized protein n=1 Tax=Streptomyces uncialis TaxID=1048205 RepID=A0A1Q4V111_9ACTN|nr:hypothetical protein [Streptomyces uncialis]OKH91486.1 hypothetical protein AB852_28425 [Streptomyces uncialis]